MFSYFDHLRLDNYPPAISFKNPFKFAEFKWSEKVFILEPFQDFWSVLIRWIAPWLKSNCISATNYIYWVIEWNNDRGSAERRLISVLNKLMAQSLQFTKPGSHFHALWDRSFRCGRHTRQCGVFRFHMSTGSLILSVRGSPFCGQNDKKLLIIRAIHTIFWVTLWSIANQRTKFSNNCRNLLFYSLLFIWII